MSLSERLRPEVEAAPWVIEEVKKLEEELDAAWMAVDLVKKENTQLREVLKFYYADTTEKQVSDVLCVDSRHSKLEAETARLRKALEEIAKSSSGCECCTEGALSREELGDAAREALEGK